MAARFWVGGSGTWDSSSTANWAATSGGASGASAPTTADTATFDANSGTAATVTVAATATASACTINKADINLSLSGSPTITGALTLTTGVLTLNSSTFTCGSFVSSNSNTRTIAFGTGSINATGNNGSVWACSTITNLAVSGSRTANLTYSGSVGTRAVANGASEAVAFNFNVSAGTDTITFSGGVGDLNFTGFAGTLGANSSTRTVYGSLTFSAGMTLSTDTGTTIFAATSGAKTITTNGKTVNAPLTFNGVGGTFRLGDNLTVGSTYTTTLTNGTLDLDGKTLTTGVFASTNSNARTVAFGTGNITLTGSGVQVLSMDILSGFTVTGTPTINATYSGSTGTRTFNVGNASGPGEANTLNINVTAGTDTVAVYGNGTRDLNFTGFSGTWASTGTNKTFFGSLTISSGMTLAAILQTLTFAATSGTKTITTSGKTVDGTFVFNGLGGTFQFTDALTQGSTRAFTITNGTVRLKAGTTNTVGSFTTGAGTTQRFLQSDTPGSPATISDASGTNTATYLTIQDTAATGGATWTALLSSNNVDAGGNSGWNFGDYASSGLSRGVGLYAGAQGLWGGNSGLWGGFSGLQN